MSLIEVERKRQLDGATQALKTRLAALGYTETGSLIEVDTYYSRPDVDFLETVECLRVRRRDGFAEITYKPASTTGTHSQDSVIAKRKTNVLLQDTDQAREADALLEAVGMVFLARVEKSRTSYRHPEQDGLTVALDTVAGVGTFAETEIVSMPGADVTRRLNEVEDELGLSSCRVVSLPYRDLVLQQGTAGTGG